MKKVDKGTKQPTPTQIKRGRGRPPKHISLKEEKVVQVSLPEREEEEEEELPVTSPEHEVSPQAPLLIHLHCGGSSLEITLTSQDDPPLKVILTRG